MSCLSIRHLLVFFAFSLVSTAQAARSQCVDLFAVDATTTFKFSIDDLRRSKEFLSKIDRSRAVAIYGSARLTEADPAFQRAFRLTKMLGEDDYITVTGGGLGIMKAANQGAKAGGGQSFAVIITLPHEITKNEFIDAQVTHGELFTRMETLVRSSSHHVFFQGGLGTLQELTHVLSLIQNRQMTRDPVILVGVEYWRPLTALLENSLLKGRTISKDDLELFKVVDTEEEAFALIAQSRR